MDAHDLVPNTPGAVALGSLIAKYRRRNDITRSTVREFCGLSLEYIRLLESGKRVTVKANLSQILGACQVPKENLIWSDTTVSIKDPETLEWNLFHFVSRVKEPRKSQKDIMPIEENDPHVELKTRDSFIGVFNIEFVGPRRMRSENVRIVHWKMSADGGLFYLIDEHGSVYNFNNINYLDRIGD